MISRFIKYRILFILLSIYNCSNVYAEVIDLLLNNKIQYHLFTDKDKLNEILDSSVGDPVWKNLHIDDHSIKQAHNKYILLLIDLPDALVEYPAMAVFISSGDLLIYSEKDTIYNSNIIDNEDIVYHNEFILFSLKNHQIGERIYIFSSHRSLDTFTERAGYYLGDYMNLSSFLKDKHIKDIKSNIIPIILIGILLFLSLFSIIVFFSISGKEKYAFLFYGLFTLLASFHSISENSLIFSVFKFLPYDVPEIKLTEIYGFVTLALLFVKNVFGQGKKKVLNKILILNFIYIFVVILFVLFSQYYTLFILVNVYSFLSLALIAVLIYIIIKSSLYQILKRNILFHIFSFLFLGVVLYSLFGTSYIFNYNEFLFLVGMFFISLAMLSILFTLYKHQQTSYHQDKLELEKSKSDMLLLQQANIMAQYETYQNRVNPHFLFNCLNTLSSLCYPNPKPEDSKKFIDEFANIYRYILNIKDKQVISVKEEIESLQSYMYLQKIRFNDELNITINLKKRYYSFMLPPLSLQILVENAIKHNKLSISSPLNILITVEGEFIRIKNNIQKLNYSEIESTKTGQRNLIERYSLLTDLLPRFYIDQNYYIAEIPVLKDET